MREKEVINKSKFILKQERFITDLKQMIVESQQYKLPFEIEEKN